MSKFSSTQELMTSDNPAENNPMEGLFKGQLTGVFLDEDNQYVDVVVEGVHRFARISYALGGRVSFPSKEFLEKFKHQIFAWVMFEENNVSRAVVIGWGWLDGKQADILDFPFADYYRTRFFRETFNDKTGEYIVGYKNDNETFGNKQTGKGWFTKFKELLFEIVETLHLKSRNSIITADKIKIGSENASEPMMLGSITNQNLQEFINITREINTQAILISTHAAAGVVSVNPGAAASLTQDSIKLQALNARFVSLSANLNKQLSQKTTVE